MATIQEKIKDGKLVSCKFKVCLGRDENKKQIFKCMTWYPPDNLTLVKSRKESELAAALWEKEINQSYLSGNAEEQATFLLKNDAEEQAEKKEKREKETIYTFEQFVNEIYKPLRLYDGSVRDTTVAQYRALLNLITPYFAAIPMQEITGVKINKYFTWLRSDYRTVNGKPLSDTTIKHHYKVLKIIFRYAERQDIITKNPISKVDAPKLSKKPVKALTENETVTFFEAISKCDLVFRCILHLLITTGLRRGECLGLQWQDVNFENSTIYVRRSVIYTLVNGINVSEPKTPTSIRTIPIMPSTLLLLKELQRDMRQQYPDTILDYAYLFGKPSNCFAVRDPNAFSKRIKRFMQANGLHDMSAHVLRHTCATLLLNSGADIKSVQEILGHTTASITLDFYVKSDIQQMRAATDKFAAAFNL